MIAERIELFAAQGQNGVFFGGQTGGDQTGDQGQRHTDAHQNHAADGRQRGDVADLGQMGDDGVDGDAQQHRQTNAGNAGGKAHDEGLGIEDAGNILLAGADGTQDADLFGALQHRDIGDDTDHNGGNHQRDGHKAHRRAAGFGEYKLYSFM